VQSSSQIITTNKPTPSFLQAGCPSCHPTNNVKALKGKIPHSMDLLTPSSPGGLLTLSLTTNSSWLPWERVAMPLISPRCQYPMKERSLFLEITPDLAGSRKRKPLGLPEQHFFTGQTTFLSPKKNKANSKIVTKSQ